MEVSSVLTSQNCFTGSHVVIQVMEPLCHQPHPGALWFSAQGFDDACSWKVRVKQRAAKRLEELLPGHSLQEAE